MARANGCDAAVDASWWWAMVLTVAVAVAALASRMLAREASRGASGRAAPVDRAELSPELLTPMVVAVPLGARAGAPRGGDPAAELLAWLCALGWVTFNGARPERWPRWDPHRARLWAAMFTSAIPGVLR